MTSSGQPGPVDDATVRQQPGEGTPAPAPGPGEQAGAGGGEEREFGVRGAVERGPAELSDEGEPVRDRPHVSLDDDEPARSTDDLQGG